MPLWHIEAEGVFRTDAATALGELDAWLAARPPAPGVLAERTAYWAKRHAERAAELAALEAPREAVTAEYLIARLRALAGDDAVFLNEGISHYHVVFNHLAPTRPGSIHTSGGGSLGWNGGAALGMKLAQPDKTVIALTGDGSYMFSAPSTVHWMARRYDAPFLQIVFNNGGWKSPRLSALAVHPDGYAAKANRLDTSFEPAPDYVGIAAAAGGAWGRQVRRADEVDDTLREALRVVREERRAAVIDVVLAHH